MLKAAVINHLAGRSDNNVDYEHYLRLYYHSLEESKALLREAMLLFENASIERAFFLGFSALEEISKSQLAADVFTGFISEAEFKKVWRDHQAKINRVKWIQLDSREPRFSQFVDIDVKDFEYVKRLGAMYVDMDFVSGTVSLPRQRISTEDAQSIISAVKVGLCRIYEVTEEWGEQIGTKGFMK
jgi:AbiV family abortive infection protein